VTAGDSSYVERLGEVLRQRDVAALRAFLVDQAARFGDERQVESIRQQSDQELEILLHRMIVARPDLGALHAESQRFLAEVGLGPARSAQPARRASRPSSSAPGHRPSRPPRPSRRPPGSDSSAV